MSEGEITPTVMTIKLSQGQVALIDVEDWPIVQPYTWYAIYDQKAHTYYAVTKSRTVSGKRNIISLHRLIMGMPPQIVDHRNGNGLDDRKVNLRLATRSGNRANSRLNRNNSTGLRGVYPATNGKYEAWITINGTTNYLGKFADPLLAARVYDAAAFAEYGEFARLNFARPTPTVIPGGISGALKADQRRTRVDNTSGYRGVTKGRITRHGQTWTAQISVSSVIKRIGTFSTAEEAARAYDAAARAAFGLQARLNFPDS